MKSTLRRLDAVHAELKTTVNGVDPALISKRPAENEWSVAEVIEHLCLVESAVMKGIKAKLAQPPVKVSFLKKFFPMRIVSLRMKRLQAPKYVQPANDLPPLDELLKKFDEQRARTREICTTEGPQRLRGVCLKHPYFGDMDGTAAVSMVAFHEQRHLKQIREIINKLTN
jgi:DinB family protein